jgi:hypothetical protein
MSRMSTWILIFVALLFSSPRAEAQNYSYGMVTAEYGPSHGQKLQELGVGWTRIDFRWDVIEPNQDNWNFAGFHAAALDAQSRGLRVFATLAYTPAWAGPCENCIPNDWSDWQDFVTHVLQEFSGYNMVFGIWNEPNIDSFLNDDDFATNYIQLFNYASQARNAVNTDIPLAGPETSHHAFLDNGYAARALMFMQMQPWDKVTVHWYPDSGMSLGDYMDYVSYWRAGHEVWLTEAGVKPLQLFSCMENYQASGYQSFLADYTLARRSWWTNLFPYVLRIAEPLCRYYHIVRSDWTNRPAFSTYQNFIANNP